MSVTHKDTAFCFTGEMFQWLPHLQDGNDLDEVKGRVVQLSNENRGNTLEESSTVHVNRCPDGQDEAADVLGYSVIFLHTLHHEGQSGRAGKTGNKGRECMRAESRQMWREQRVYFRTEQPRYLRERSVRV